MLNAEKLNTVLTAATDNGDLPGVVAGITDCKQVLYQHATGVRQLSTDTAMGINTVCHIASMTKPITAVAVLLLIEQNKLSLDEPAGEVIPFFYDIQVLTGFDERGKPQTRPPKHPITLRHLLTHTAGCANEAWSTDTARCIASHNKPGSAQRYNASLHAPLMHDPGERWWYGMGLDWAGRMIETVSGKYLGDFLQQQLFNPLSMHDTSFQLKTLRERLATVHQRDASGDLSPLTAVPPDIPPYERGGGGLYSTVADYLAFIRLLLNDGWAGNERLLQADSMALLTENQIGALRVVPLTTAQLLRSRDLDMFPDIDKSWSLGFMINEQMAPTGRPAGSLAWGGINNTYFWIDRHNGIGGVFMSQVLPFMDVKALPLYFAFETAVYQNLPA